MKTYQELVCWQKAHAFALEVYRVTEDFPKREMFNLTNQVRRAVLSVPTNIVEGFRRKSMKDSLHFYNIAQGSLEEVRYLILFARDIGILEGKQYDHLEMKATETSKILNAWIVSQRKFLS